MRKNGFAPVIILVIIAIAAVVAGAYFIGKNEITKKTTSGPISTSISSSTPSPTGTPSPKESLETYKNTAYGFELKYPKTFKIVEDKYGWPKAVLLLYKGGQSYDLAVEVWSSEEEYKQKYSSDLYDFTVKEKNGKFITLLNVNKEAEVAQIISTFKFTQ